MKTIVINLLRRKDRKEYVTEHLKQFPQLEVSFFPAFDGAQMNNIIVTPPHRSYFSFRDQFGQRTNTLNRFQVACAFSHASVLKIAESLNEHVLILEDDVELSDDFNKLFDSNNNFIYDGVPDDFEMLYLGGAVRNNLGQPSTHVNDKVIIPGFTDGLQGYIVTPKGARKLSIEMMKFNTTNDDCVNDVKNREKDPLITYMLKNKVAFQIESYSDLDQKIMKREDLR